MQRRIAPTPQTRSTRVDTRAPVGEADHRAAIVNLQRSAGNAATARLLGTLQRAPITASTTHPLSAYPYLKQALTPEQYNALDNPEGRLTVPLMQLLPPGVDYQTREQLLATRYANLAGVDGPAPNAAELVEQITDSETLRRFLEPRLRSPVSMVVEFDSTVSFHIDGLPVQTDQGMIRPTALDRVSIATMDSVAREAHEAAVQLVDLRFLEAMATYASEHIMPLALEVAADPGDYALAEVEQMARETTNLATLAHKMRDAGVRPYNADRAGALAGSVAVIDTAHTFTTTATRASTSFAEKHTVDNTAGETYDEAEDDYAEDAGLSRHGVLSAGNWFATKVFHTAGNLLTAGHLDRQASNAKAYQEGRISYHAYQENEGWNIAKSLVVAVATAVSGGLASRLASGLFAVDAGFTATGESTLTGTFVGGVGGASGAMTSDAVSKIAAGATDDRYVRDYQNQSVGGPLSWLTGAMTGAMTGGLFGRLFGGKGKSGGGEPDSNALREQATREDVADTAPIAVVGDSAEPVAYIRGKPCKPTAYGTIYHGNDITPQQVLEAGGLPAKGNNWDLINHVEEMATRDNPHGTSAFRGGTRLQLSPDRQAGAALWGKYIYKIKGMPTWDINQLMEGQRGDTGNFSGNIMRGELENAFPARVPIENIEAYAEVVQREGSGGQTIYEIKWQKFSDLVKK